MDRHQKDNPFGEGDEAKEEEDHEDVRESVLGEEGDDEAGVKKSKHKRKKKRNKKKKNRGDVTVGHSTEPEDPNHEGGFKLQRQGPAAELQIDKSKIEKILQEHAK